MKPFMKKVIERKAVWFNIEAVSVFELLKKDGFTTRSFKDFVKEAFYNKIDKLRR